MVSVKPSGHYVHELSTDDEERLNGLFQQLDVDGDGKIDVHDLTKGLKKLGVHQTPGQAQRIITKADKNKDGHMDLSEFVQYLAEHEKNLKLQFRNVDKDQDGHIDKREVMSALEELGITVTDSQVHKIIQSMEFHSFPPRQMTYDIHPYSCHERREFLLNYPEWLVEAWQHDTMQQVNLMDKDGTYKIDWHEWREYLLFHPGSELKDIYRYWRHATFIDIGDDVIVPDDFTEQEYTSGMWWRQLVAGGAAGAVSRTCTAPLDRLKVLLQVHASKKNDLGIVTGLRHMIKEGGMKSLWRGNGINVIKIAPETAFKFMAYEQFKRLLHTPGTDLKAYERFTAGSLAGAFAQTTIYPMEVLKTRLALRKTGQYKGIGDCARKIFRAEGLTSFYRGYIPNLLGIIPYAGIDLAVYETLRNSWIEHHPDESDPGVLVLLLCGTTSSTCGQLASYPLALIRTRLQAQDRSLCRLSASQQTMVGLFKTIVKEEGVTGLYRGIMPNFMKVAPAVSISYVVYEHVRKTLGVNWGTK